MRSALLITSALGLGLVATTVAAQRDGQRDTLSEMQRERGNPAVPSVPLQNRDAAEADRLRAAEPAAWLRNAQDSLRRNRPGEANELLERAETRLITRSTPADQAGQPAQMPAVRHIADARGAVQTRDRTNALRHIDLAVAALGGSAAAAATPISTQGGPRSGTMPMHDRGHGGTSVTRAVVLAQASGGLSGSSPGSPGTGTSGSTPGVTGGTTQQPPQGAATSTGPAPTGGRGAPAPGTSTPPTPGSSIGTGSATSTPGSGTATGGTAGGQSR